MAQVGDALTDAVMRASIGEHRAIAKAIVEGDGAAAAAAMRAHLERAAALAVASRKADVNRRPHAARSSSAASRAGASNMA